MYVSRSFILLALPLRCMAQLPHVPTCSKSDLMSEISTCATKACSKDSVSVFPTEVMSVMHSQCEKPGHPLPSGTDQGSSTKSTSASHTVSPSATKSADSSDSEGSSSYTAPATFGLYLVMSLILNAAL
ncbi:hypothetical protein BGZ63DRAFT_404696 [Mariannaea sp. PMI_226]|nr:hypothetical protein BGZ63DRAFT_404696 [Mariannaea sp. PMI_226]